MSRMNIPDFTAEASLTRTSAHYCTAGIGAAQDASGAVVPQFSWCFLSNIYPGTWKCCTCDEYGGGCVCRYKWHNLFPPENGE
jgi:hypothetical protein